MTQPERAEALLVLARPDMMQPEPWHVLALLQIAMEAGEDRQEEL